MRENKFRGKLIDNGEWVYGDLLQNEQGSFIVEEFEACNPYGDDGDSLFGMVWHQVIPETVGQYTGRKDKGLVEIYEGDIMIFEAKPGVWAGQTRSPEEVRFPFICGNAYLGEVIGNITDNPELLEVKE